MIFSGGAAAAAEQQQWQVRAASNVIRIAHCIYIQIRMYKSEREWVCACECQTMHAHFGTAQFQ